MSGIADESYIVGGKWHVKSEAGAEVETSELLASVVRLAKPMICFESGTNYGDTAEAIGRALQQNGCGVLHTAEIDTDKVEHCRARLEGLPVVVYEKEGKRLLEELGMVDFAFIDSGWLPVRLEEASIVTRHISAHGFLALHDCCQNYGPVYELVQQSGWNHVVFDSPFGLALFQNGLPSFERRGQMVPRVKA